MKANPESLVRAFLDAENARDWEAWASQLAPDVAFELVGSGRAILGRANYVAHMRQVYSELPDWKFGLVNVASKSGVVIVEFRGEGHFSGKYNDRRYQHVALKLSAVCVFEVSDGQITRVREYFDQVGYEHQLGLSGPEPGA